MFAAVDVRVFWRGEPLSGASMRLLCDEVHEEGSEETDDGFVHFPEGPVETGLNGIIVRHVEKDQAGEIDGERFTSASHYDGYLTSIEQVLRKP